MAFNTVEAWPAAALRCAREGGQQSTDRDFHVGITDAGFNTRRRTLTGETAFEPFLFGEPDNLSLIPQDACFHFGLRAGATGLDDMSCAATLSDNVRSLSALCELPKSGSFCGDGIVQEGLGESCDDANGGCVACGAATNQNLAHALVDDAVLIAVSGPAAAGDVRRTFGGADLVCSELGSKLATLESVTQNEALAKILGHIGESAWIGYRDFGAEAGSNASAFTRVDDSLPIGTRFEAFDTDEPNGGGAQNCVLADPAGAWSDEVCGTLRPYVCELR